MHIKESAALNDYFFIPGQHNEFILHLFMKKIIGFIRDYFIEVEQNEGIHIIDNSNLQQAKKVSFLKIPGCSEIAIRNNYLYSNNLNDLIVFDLSNLTAPQLVNRLENAFPQFSQSYPPFSDVYFECPDPSKGVVIAWEQKSLSSAKCRR